MAPSNQVSKYLCPNSAVSTEQRMCRSLTDVFQMMFNLDLVSTSYRSPEQKDFIPAHILLSNEQATACISLRISREAALLIAQRAGIKVTDESSAQIVQDVACEIVNIVGNNLRTYFCETLGVNFEMALPISGEASQVRQPNIVLNMDFQATPEALVSMDFLCSEGMADSGNTVQ